MDIRHTAKLSMHNRRVIESAEICGCYHCLSMFRVEEIKEWTDGGDTAICPKCSVDSVLPEGIDFRITAESLDKLRRYWF
jgi:hypothetical protein